MTFNEQNRIEHSLFMELGLKHNFHVHSIQYNTINNNVNVQLVSNIYIFI